MSYSINRFNSNSIYGLSAKVFVYIHNRIKSGFSVIKLLVSALLLSSISAVYAENTTAFDHKHSAFSQVLAEVVHTKNLTSRVDYTLLKKQPNQLKVYLATITSVSKTQFDSFSKEQQIAFLINYYNSHQLLQVIDHYPLKSIRDLGFLVFTPWQKEFFKLFGKPANLDFIGHDLLEPYKEPRVHFALNCASIGCPPLLNEAYQGDVLEQQLTKVSTDFLANTTINRYNSDKHLLHISSIFKWYEKDFGGEKGVQRFVAEYMKSFSPKKELADIEYDDYDWNLNDLKSGF